MFNRPYDKSWHVKKISGGHSPLIFYFQIKKVGCEKNEKSDRPENKKPRL